MAEADWAFEEGETPRAGEGRLVVRVQLRGLQPDPYPETAGAEGVNQRSRPSVAADGGRAESKTTKRAALRNDPHTVQNDIFNKLLNHLQSVLLYVLFKNGLPSGRDIIINGQVSDCIFGTAMHYSLFRWERSHYKFFALPDMSTLLQLASGFNQGARRICTRMDEFHRKQLPLSDIRNPLWTFASYGDYEWVERHFQARPEDIIAARYQAIRWSEGRSFYDVLSLYDLDFDGSTTMSTWAKLAERHKRTIYYPFATNALLDFAFSIPWRLKLSTPKHAMREVANTIGIPPSIVSRPKLGFGVFSNRWAKQGAIFEPLVPLAATVIGNSDIRDLQGSTERRAMTFWTLLNYAVWKRLHIYGDSADQLIGEIFSNSKHTST